MKKVTQKTVAGMAMTLLTIINAFGVSKILIPNELNKKAIDNQKPIEQVLKEGEALGFDQSEMMDRNGLLRLGFIKGEPVIIRKDASLNDSCSQAVEDVSAYLNKIFSTICKDYTFETVDSDYQLNFSQPAINILQKEIDDEKTLGHAATTYGPAYLYSPIAIGAKITISDKVDNYDQAFNVILHEVTHALGRDDAYHKEDTKRQLESIMYSYNSEEVKTGYTIYDYTDLLVCYSDDYLYHDTFQETIAAMQEKIDTYASDYYTSLYNKNCNIQSDLDSSKDYLFNYSCMRTLDEKDTIVNYNFKIQGKSYNLDIYDDKTGAHLETISGEIVRLNDKIVLKSVNPTNLGILPRIYANNHEDLDYYLIKDGDKFRLVDTQDYFPYFNISNYSIIENTNQRR